MTLTDVWEVLQYAERTGADTDVPEGSRVVALSETLVNEMLQAFIGSDVDMPARRVHELMRQMAERSRAAPTN